MKSKRSIRFNDVVQDCIEHIETYTVRQYGDYPNDQLTNMTLSDVKHDMQRYINRMESNARGPAEAKRDMLKLMHYAAEAYLMLEEAGHEA